MVKRRSVRAAGRGGSSEPEQVLYLESGCAVGGMVSLEGTEADHARRSLRLRPGDALSVVDGQGSRFHGTVSALEKHAVVLHLDRVETLLRWPQRELWLAAGVLKSTRMDFVIEKASELGVSRLIPVVFKHCVARPHEDGSKRERWARIAVESLKQSKRSHLMRVEDPHTLTEFLEMCPDPRTLWVADTAGDAPSEVDPRGPVICVVGPEGGLAPEELTVLDAARARRVRLGGNRLRAETAGVALTVAALVASGELNN